MSVCRYPTIYFAPVGRKDEPIRYEVTLNVINNPPRSYTYHLAPVGHMMSSLSSQGGRELKDFLKFLKRESSHSLQLGGSKEEL